ncbi:MAG: dTMP kinase [Peptococcaceae bacterium]|nr:dTMP kinase [Peptococcaceae bacterium]
MVETGLFIVLEGLDGSGTTTQAALLKEWFSREGAIYGRCIATNEPTAGPAGSMARLALNHRISLDSRTMALLFAADRTDHLYKEDNGRQEPGLAQLLRQGAHVVSDRYLLSSLAYQSLDLPMEWILQINAMAIAPDLTFFLEVDPQISRERLQQGRSHQDLFEGSDTQLRVCAQYEEAIRLLEHKGQTIHRIDGNRPAEAVHQDIVHGVLPLLKSCLST